MPSSNRIVRTVVIASALVTLLSFFEPSILRFGMDPRFLWIESPAATAVRFVLFQFLHGGILHFVSNAFFLLYFGSAVERDMGESRFLTFFIASTAFVGTSLLFFAHGNTVGASGFAMAVLSYAALRMRAARNEEYRAAMFFVFLNVAFGFVGNVSLVGHASGAIAGFLWYGIESLTKRYKNL